MSVESDRPTMRYRWPRLHDYDVAPDQSGLVRVVPNRLGGRLIGVALVLGTHCYSLVWTEPAVASKASAQDFRDLDAWLIEADAGVGLTLDAEQARALSRAVRSLRRRTTLEVQR